jgi:nicotinamide-nucleotide amidase
MRAEILTVGTELTSGAVINSNAAEIARQLASLGIDCARQTSVSDERLAVTAAIREAIGRAELVLMTGGLGPTFDDITMEAIGAATGRPLREVPAVAAAIRRFYARHHRAVQRAALRQARIPEGGRALPNRIGTAPGLWLPLPGGRALAALPGVPGEMRAMLAGSVVPALRRSGGRGAIESLTLRTCGLVELQIERLLRALPIPAGVDIGLYPHLRMVDIRLTARAATSAAARRAIAPLARALRRGLGEHCYGTGGDTLEGAAGTALATRRLTLAVAESCTGGAISDRLTDAPGSSRYLLGAVVAYHNRVKTGPLRVPAHILSRHGAVSNATAAAMARGVRAWAGASVGLAVTGIAGPDGGSARKPVGLVCFGLADARGARTRRMRFSGGRRAIKLQAVQVALDWLRRSAASRRAAR